MNCIICKSTMDSAVNELYFKCSQCNLISSGFNYNKEIYNENYAINYQNYEGQEKTTALMDIRTTWLDCVLYEGDRVLDYGCSVGTFLNHLNGRYKKAGYDISKDAIEIAKNLHSKNSKSIFYYNFEFAEEYGPYDAITMWDVIEHFQNPIEEIQKITKCLRKDGNLFISTPNVDACEGEVSHSWRHYKPREHLHYFNAHTLSKLLQMAGFNIQQINYKETEVRNTYPENILGVLATKK